MENVNTTIPSEATIAAPLPTAEKVFTEPAKVVDNGSKPKAKKTATPKKRARDVKELINAATKNMTDKEKDNLIEYLKSEMHLMDNKLEALRNNCEQDYAKCRACEEEYAAMEKYYRDRLGYIDQQLTAFGNAVKLSIVGGLN